MKKCDYTVRAVKVYGAATYTYITPVIVRDGNVSPMHAGEKIKWCYVEEPQIKFDSTTCVLTIGTQSVSLKGNCSTSILPPPPPNTCPTPTITENSIVVCPTPTI